MKINPNAQNQLKYNNKPHQNHRERCAHHWLEFLDNRMTPSCTDCQCIKYVECGRAPVIS